MINQRENSCVLNTNVSCPREFYALCTYHGPLPSTVVSRLGGVRFTIDPREDDDAANGGRKYWMTAEAEVLAVAQPMSCMQGVW